MEIIELDKNDTFAQELMSQYKKSHYKNIYDKYARPSKVMVNKYTELINIVPPHSMSTVRLFGSAKRNFNLGFMVFEDVHVVTTTGKYYKINLLKQ